MYTHKTEPTLKTSEKKAVTDSVAHLCSIDLRPFNINAGTGLEEFTAVLYNLGYKHGQIGKTKVPVQNILPHRTTVSRTLQQNASLAREEFKLFLKNTGVSRYGVALDFWKNDMTGDNYLGVSLHFKTNYSLCWSNLATRLFNEKKTGPAIVEYVRSVLNEHDMSQSADIVFVTDNASNMVKAFENKLHLRCACHCLNLAIGQALSIDELGETLASCRKLVQHFKQSGLQKFVSTTLKQTCVTRWNSTYFMIESILKIYDEIVGLLATRHEMRLIANLDFELLGELKKISGCCSKCKQRTVC